MNNLGAGCIDGPQYTKPHPVGPPTAFPFAQNTQMSDPTTSAGRWRLYHAHPWDLVPREAMQVQRKLAAQVKAIPLPQPVRTIAGVDVSVRGDRVRTAIVVVALPSLDVVDEAVWEGPVAYPYVPGLLSFREMPAILPALDRLSTTPDLFMTDSQGWAHPRRFGLACHLGVLLDRPALGVAKTRLIGTHDVLPVEKGNHVALMDRGEEVGRMVRTRTGVKPVYVSIGHRVTLAEAVALTLACAPRYKIPEPTRLAHLLSKRQD